MNKRLWFAIALLLSVILIICSSYTDIVILAVIGYLLMSILFLSASFSLLVLKQTSILTGGKSIPWEKTTGALKASMLVCGLGMFAAALYIIFVYLF